MKPETKDRLKIAGKSLAQLGVGIIMLVAVFAGIIWYDEHERTDHEERARIAMDMAIMLKAEEQVRDAEWDIGYLIGGIYNSMRHSSKGNASSAAEYCGDSGKYLVTAMMLFDDADDALKSDSTHRIFVYRECPRRIEGKDNVVCAPMNERTVYTSWAINYGWFHSFSQLDAESMRESIKQHRELESQYRALLNGTEKTVAATRHLSNYRTLMNTSGCSREVALYELGLARVEIDGAADVFIGVREGCYSGIWNATHADERFSVVCDERKSLVCQTAAECEKVVDEIQEVIYNETKNNR